MLRPPMAARRVVLLTASVVEGVRGLEGILASASPLLLLLEGVLALALFGVPGVLAARLVTPVPCCCWVAPSAATSSVLMDPMNTTRGVKPVRAAHTSAGRQEKVVAGRGNG